MKDSGCCNEEGSRFFSNLFGKGQAGRRRHVGLGLGPARQRHAVARRDQELGAGQADAAVRPRNDNVSGRRSGKLRQECRCNPRGASVHVVPHSFIQPL